jgi:hypothetical protein
MTELPQPPQQVHETRDRDAQRKKESEVVQDALLPGDAVVLVVLTGSF